VSPADHKEHTVKAAPSESFLDSMKKIGLTYRF
jgi:hypothetical protein